MAKVILQDIGHTEKAKGAMGYADEYLLNKLDQEATYRHIRNMGGHSVILQNGTSRLTDMSVPVRQANKYGVNAIFYSRHNNSATSKLATGYETLVYPTAYKGTTKELVDSVHAAYGSVAKKYGLTDRGIKKQDVYVLRETAMAACLLEGGFVSNQKDAGIISQSKFIEESSLAVAKALMKVAGQNIVPPKPTPVPTPIPTTPQPIAQTLPTKTLPQGDYLIVSKMNGKVLTQDQFNFMVTNTQLMGDKIQIWTWDGLHFINKDSGLYLDVFGNDQTAGQPVIAHKLNGGLNQQFIIGQAGEIIAKHSNQVLDVREKDTRDFAFVMQFKPNNGTNQQWAFLKLQS